MLPLPLPGSFLPLLSPVRMCEGPRGRHGATLRTSAMTESRKPGSSHPDARGLFCPLLGLGGEPGRFLWGPAFPTGLEGGGKRSLSAFSLPV